MKQGNIIVISSPSGGGKTTVGIKLLTSSIRVTRSISMTTRKIRKGEKNKRDYFFVTKEEFKRILSKDGFLEHAKVFGQLYGTPKSFVNKQRKAGKDVLLLIDVQGAKQIKKKSPDAILIFLMPPSIKELKRRLKNRSTDSSREITKRLKVAKKEISQARSFDYIVPNIKLSDAMLNLKAIIKAERYKVNKP